MPPNSAAIDGAGVTLVSAEQRPDLIPAFADLNAPAWPKFLDGDEAIIECWDSLFTDGLSRYQFAAVRLDERGEEKVLAVSFAEHGRCNLTYWEFPGYDHGLSDGTGASHMTEVMEQAASWLRHSLSQERNAACGPAR